MAYWEILRVSECCDIFKMWLKLFFCKTSCSQDYSELVGQCWLQSARVARKAGHHQTAYNALLNAGESTLSELYIERAKWLWSKVNKIKIEFTFLHVRKQSLVFRGKKKRHIIIVSHKTDQLGLSIHSDCSWETVSFCIQLVRPFLYPLTFLAIGMKVVDYLLLLKQPRVI